MSSIQLVLNENYYLKDPQNTELGKKIISASIRIIDELGFEQFTFKKLALEIGSTEASIYRYFDNKHRLLTYLVAWYWGWMEYQIEYQTHYIVDPIEKVKKILELLTKEVEADQSFEHIDEVLLHQIVIAESDKTYLTKNVDTDNKEGLFRGYKSLCEKIANAILSINPDYPYSRSLVSTIIEASHQQVFFSNHLPRLSDVKKEDENRSEVLKIFLESLVFGAISIHNPVIKNSAS